MSPFRIKAVSAGYIRELARGHGVTLGLGLRGSLSFVPGSLAEVYGSSTPVGGMVFLRLRPLPQRMEAMAGMQH